MEAKLFVGNLPYPVRSNELKDILDEMGVVYQRVEVVMERENPERSRGFGFIHFETDVQAAVARTALTGLDVGGRILIVDTAVSDRPGRRAGGNGRAPGGRGRRDEGPGPRPARDARRGRDRGPRSFRDNGSDWSD